MPPYVTTKFGRQAYKAMGAGRTTRGAGAKGKATKPITLDMIMSRIWGQQLTPAQQRKQARQDAALAIKESLRELRSDYEREYATSRREQEGYKALSATLAGYRTADAAAIGETYQQAAQAVGGTNTGLVSALQGAQQANLAAGEAASASLAGYDKPLLPGSAGANAAVGQYLGATLPVGTISAQGAAQETRARLRGEAYSQRAAQEVTQRLAPEIERMRDEYLRQRGDIRAKKPSLYRDALKAIQEGDQAGLATIISAITLQGTQGAQAWNQTMDVAELNALIEKNRQDAIQDEKDRKRKIRDAKRTAKNQAERDRIDDLAAQGLAPDGKTPLPGFYRHPSGRILGKGTYIADDGSVQNVPQGWKVGKNGKLVKAPYPQGGGDGAGGVSTADRIGVEQTFRKDAQVWAASQINVDPKLGRPRRPPPSKQALIKGIMRLYAGPLLGRYGITQAMLRQWATQVVNSFPSKYWATKTTSTTPTTPSGTTGKSGLEGYEE